MMCKHSGLPLPWGKRKVLSSQGWSLFLPSGPLETESMTPVHLFHLWHILFYEFLMFQTVYFGKNSSDYKRVLSILQGAWWMAGSWHVCSGEKPRGTMLAASSSHTPPLQGRLKPFGRKSSAFSSAPFRQLSFGCSVSYRVVIWD